MIRLGRGSDPHEEYRLLAAAAVDGRIDPDSASALQSHIATCPSCREFQAALLEDHRWLAEPTPTRASPAVRAFVLEAARAPRVPRVDDRRGSFAPVLASGVVVAVVAVLLSSLAFGGPSGPTPSLSPINTLPSRSPAALSPFATPSAPATPSPTLLPSPTLILTAPVERLGQELGIWPSPPATFPADLPFHLAGGYCLEPQDFVRVGMDNLAEAEAVAIGLHAGTRVDFHVDGVPIASERESLPPPAGCLVLVRSVANLPAGIGAGLHHFEARWFLGDRPDFVRTADIVFE